MLWFIIISIAIALFATLICVCSAMVSSNAFPPRSTPRPTLHILHNGSVPFQGQEREGRSIL